MISLTKKARIVPKSLYIFLLAPADLMAHSLLWRNIDSPFGLCVDLCPVFLDGKFSKPHWWGCNQGCLKRGGHVTRKIFLKVIPVQSHLATGWQNPSGLGYQCMKLDWAGSKADRDVGTREQVKVPEFLLRRYPEAFQLPGMLLWMIPDQYVLLHCTNHGWGNHSSLARMKMLLYCYSSFPFPKEQKGT